MADIFGRIIKPTSEFIEDLARKLPEALGKGHHRIGQHIHKAADEFDKAEDDVTAKAAHHPHNHGEGHHNPEDLAGAGTAAAAGAKGSERAAANAAHDASREGDDGTPDLRPGDSDRAAVPGSEKHCETDPVDVATGDVVMPVVDVALPGALPLVLERTHVSSYRHGRLFGPSWASTLDQRLQLDAAGVVFASADGMRLEYPPPHADAEVMPNKGPRRPLHWSGSVGDPMRITDPGTGESLVFGRPRPAPGLPGSLILRLVTVTDRDGNRVDIEWNDRELPTLLTHHGGYRVAVDHHPVLPRITGYRLLGTEGPDTHTALLSFDYDAAGDLAAVTNSSGAPLRITYDIDHRVTGWTDRNDTRYRYSYDDRGRVTATEGSGGITRSPTTTSRAPPGSPTPSATPRCSSTTSPIVSCAPPTPSATPRSRSGVATTALSSA